MTSWALLKLIFRPGTVIDLNYYRNSYALIAPTAVDVKEYPNSYVVIADMPGLEYSTVTVTVENGNVLVISGERKKEDEPGAVKYLCVERSGVKFLREFTLPSDVDAEQMDAAYEDGVLTVTFPKIPPSAPKFIFIEVL